MMHLSKMSKKDRGDYDSSSPNIDLSSLFLGDENDRIASDSPPASPLPSTAESEVSSVASNVTSFSEELDTNSQQQTLAFLLLQNDFPFSGILMG